MLRNFKKITKFDIAAAQQALEDYDEMFGKIDLREKFPGSPHPNTQTLYLRMPDDLDPHIIFNSLQVDDWPMMTVEEFRDLVIQINQVVDEPLARVLIVKLFPGGTISSHIDEGIYSDSTNRYHLVLKTNPRAFLKINDEVEHLEEGWLYSFNKHLLHSGANEGDTDRIHLIVDTFKAGVANGI